MIMLLEKLNRKKRRSKTRTTVRKEMMIMQINE